MATQTEIGQVLKMLAGAFPDWNPPKPAETLGVYTKRLGEYPIELLQKAAERCLDSCLTFPKIKELRQACDAIHAIRSLNTYEKRKEDDKRPPSPEMQKFLDDFRENFREKHGITTSRKRVFHE